MLPHSPPSPCSFMPPTGCKGRKTCPTEDITDLIRVESVECLNENPSHSSQHLLYNSLSGSVRSDLFLESKIDEQLVLHIPFVYPVNINAITVFSEDSEYCPKTIKLFRNRPNLDFVDLSSVSPVQILDVPRDCEGCERRMDLRFVKFRNVTNLTMVVEKNHGAPTTVLTRLRICGTVQGLPDYSKS